MSTVLKGLTLWLVCDRCGAERSLATGAVAQTLPAEKVIESGTRVGWLTDPENNQTACPGCLLKLLRAKPKRTK